MHAEGLGGSQDFAEARRLYGLAAAQGSVDARQALEKLARASADALLAEEEEEKAKTLKAKARKGRTKQAATAGVHASQQRDNHDVERNASTAPASEATRLGDEALGAAMADGTYETLAAALETHCASASEAVLTQARAMRDKLKEKRKKQRQKKPLTVPPPRLAEEEHQLGSVEAANVAIEVAEGSPERSLTEVTGAVGSSRAFVEASPQPSAQPPPALAEPPPTSPADPLPASAPPLPPTVQAKGSRGGRGRGGRGRVVIQPSANSVVSTPPPALSVDSVLATDYQALTLADLAGTDVAGRNKEEVPESTIGGETTCIVCFANPKTHITVPCGHLCACSDCSAKMTLCPYCREPVMMWMHARVV